MHIRGTELSMRKYFFSMTMLILFMVYLPVSVTYAQENNSHLSNIEKMISVFNDNTNLGEKISYIRNNDLNNWPVQEMNQVLDKLDNLRQMMALPLACYLMVQSQ